MASTAQPNPRRPPAHASVSLKRRTSPLQDANESGNSKSTSPSSLQPFGERASSGESSNADQWFNNKNKNGGNEMDFADNDPPFFMRNNSSSETPPGAQQQHLNASTAVDSLPQRTGLIRMGTDGSSTEDYRGKTVAPRIRE